VVPPYITRKQLRLAQSKVFTGFEEEDNVLHLHELGHVVGGGGGGGSGQRAGRRLARVGQQLWLMDLLDGSGFDAVDQRAQQAAVLE
jgi:NAD(P)H-hydrate repair Nnr-like enzyme with NAD(P)H-hydrate epimerase domain